MAKMKGFAMLGIGKIGWIEKEVPKCGPMDAICKPVAISPCTSDVHTVWAGALGERHDMILGHEAVGEVVEVGSLVKDFKKGDKVIVSAITPDWDAVASQRGFSMHDHGALSGWKFSNFKDGVFGENFHVNQADANLTPLPKSLDAEACVMLADMVATGFHGAQNADIQYGETVAVIGIGPVGLMSVKGADLKGASRIIAVGSRPNTIEVAKGYGATDIVNYRDGDIVEQINELTKANGEGVDKVIIAGGDNDTFDQALRIIRPAGIISNVNYLGEGDYIKLGREAWQLGMGHIQITGGLTPGGRYYMTYLSRLMECGKLDPSLLLTHRFNGFEHIEEALLLMKDKPKDLIKPVVTI